MDTGALEAAARKVVAAATGVEAAGDWSGLLRSHEESCRELVSVASRLDEREAATPLHAEFWSEGELRVERDMTLTELLGVVGAHAAGHTQQIAELPEPSK